MKTPGLNIALTVLVAASVSGCQSAVPQDARRLTTLVAVEGSNTMSQLMNGWATEFMVRYPEVPISVTTGDSSSGIRALVNGTTDLAASSRDLTAVESQVCRAKRLHLRKITVARDAIAIIVNPFNTIDSLALSQVKEVFSGETAYWSGLGGPRKQIAIFRRELSSGTNSYFEQHVLRGVKFSDGARQISSSKGLTEAVAKDRWSIAYVGLGHALAAGKAVKILKLRLENEGTSSVEPTQVTATGAYPLSRPLFFFMDVNSKPSVQRFVDFCLSSDGQKIVARNGYVSMNR